MIARVHLCLGAIAAAALAISSAASAATLTVDHYERGQLGTAQAAMSSYQASVEVKGLETFSEYASWDGHSGTSDLQNTKVGSFTAFGATGSGKSVVGDGSRLQVRGDDTMHWGRYSTAPLGGHWLDSNDNLGMTWQVGGLGKFNALAFFVIDAADVGGKFSIKVGDTLFSDLAGGARLANGNIQFVKILLDKAVTHLTVQLMHDRTNDGFGIDGAAVAKIAPAPLPPAALLLVTGIAGIAGMRRRRSAAAAA
jgi:hypothetical protein